MRPIKFRGKSDADWVYTGWVYGGLIHDCNGKPIINIEGYAYGGTGIHYRYLVKSETVGQFTGLLDKNGKEIYEGDFVEWCFFDCQQREHFLRGNIKWYQGGFILNITENDFEKAGYYAISDLSTDTESDVEILGNVHDNPELLKGGNNETD